MRPGRLGALGASLCVLGACAGGAAAGDLNPPPGPIAPTGMRILSQATTPPPIEITEPGHYVLMSDLTGVSAASGIEIQTNDVTIDLNGFAMRGVPGSIDAIRVPGIANNITIRNGIVKDWRGNGLQLSNGQNCIVEDVLAENNVFAGIASGTNSIVRNCVSIQNGGQGILVDNASTVIGCTTSFNAGDGINGSQGVTIESCTSYENLSFGIRSLDASNIRGCTVYANDGSGIAVAQGSLVAHCTAFQNAQSGIRLDDECAVIECTAYQNTFEGIFTDRSCLVARCSAGQNEGPSISVGTYTMVRDCLASDAGMGIGMKAGIEVRGTNCWIDSNACVNNTGEGIVVLGTDNVITRNYLQDNEDNLIAVGGNQIGTLSTSPVGAGPWDNLSFPP